MHYNYSTITEKQDCAIFHDSKNRDMFSRLWK